MQLPGPLGGMGIRTSLRSADAAFLATYEATASRVKVVCRELGRPTGADIGKADAEAAAQRLAVGGVKVHACS